VGKVNATDRDDPKTTHVKIRFTLLDGLEHFAIHPETGVITTVTNTLDREVSPVITELMISFVYVHVAYCLTFSFYLNVVLPMLLFKAKDKHLVTVMIKDLNGAVNGLYNTATATITLSDVNDNPPTFTKTSVSAWGKEKIVKKQEILFTIKHNRGCLSLVSCKLGCYGNTHLL